nr:transposase [Nostoc flagelliforme]
MRAVKVRLYPTPEQQTALSRSFGCARWYWNYALNACVQHYVYSGKTLKMSVYKGLLPQLKVEYPWLKQDCYSSVLQCVAINLDKAYKNFFEGRAKFPKFKSKFNKQSIQYPQSVTVVGDKLKIPKIGEVKAVFHRQVLGIIKTVTISKTVTDKYFASILVESECSDHQLGGDKILGIDLGLKDFAIVHDGEEFTKYSNAKHLKRHKRNLARKQKKFARKVKGSKSRHKHKKLVAKVHERVSNSRQDFLHKLSRKLVNESQIIVVENLHIKGMVRNRKLSKSISDVGWGMFINFLDYKLKDSLGQLVEIDRFFPSSKTCSCCGHVVDELPLDIREWDCRKCKYHHNRNKNASQNMRTEGIRILSIDGGNPVLAESRRSKTKKPQGAKAFVDETGSPHPICTQMGVG